MTPSPHTAARACAAAAETISIELDPAPGTLSPAETARLRALIDHMAPVAAQRLSAFGEARVRVLPDAPMAQAHERHTGIPGPTDVLTFDLSDAPRQSPSDRAASDHATFVDADVLICSDEARRQAAAMGHPVERELALYILHAVLHCCGHDDHDDEAFERMHELEDRILTEAGIGPTFAPAPCADATPARSSAGGAP